MADVSMSDAPPAAIDIMEARGGGGAGGSGGSVAPGSAAGGASSASSNGAALPAKSSLVSRLDAIAEAAAASKQQQKSNSTSSIYITSTLVKPDTDEVVFCIAAVIHDHIQQGERMGSDERNRFPFFSEDNNPLYAAPPEHEGRGSDSESSDSSTKRTRREVPTEDMIFHTIRSVFECARIPSECLIVSLVYIERLIAISNCPLLVTTWRPILLSSLILAQKVWDDRSLHNVDFSIFCPMFTLKEINFLEKKFLELIDFDVSISASIYASYFFQLRTLCQRVDRDFTLQPMDVDSAAKLEARGVAYQHKLRDDHGASRKNKSDNIIHGGAPGAQSSSFLKKLFHD